MISNVFYTRKKENHKKIERAILLVNKIFKLKVFLKLVEYVEYFEMSNDDTDTVSGQEMADIIRWYTNNTFPPIKIKTYWPKHWWSGGRRAYAWVSEKNHSKINLNERLLKKDVPGICNTLAHEIIHLIDYKHPSGFGHGGNSPKGKKKTAPWKIGAIVESIASQIIEESEKSE